MMNDIKHLFFDLDHTLWDFERNSKETLSELYEEFKLEAFIQNKDRFLATYQTVNAIYWKKYRDGKIDKQTVRFGRFSDTLKRLKVKQFEELGKTIGDEYVVRGPQKRHLFPNTHETLKNLQEKYPLHIITNGFKEVQSVKMGGTDLERYFDLILCSEDVGVNKPNKKVFERALEITGCKAENAVMIGDNIEADIQGAKKVGMSTILFDPKNEHTSYSTEYNHLIIQDLSELQEIF